MAQSEITVKLSIKLPWWWRLYFWALIFFSDMGILKIDTKVAADFVARHTKVRACRR